MDILIVLIAISLLPHAVLFFVILPGAYIWLGAATLKRSIQGLFT